MPTHSKTYSVDIEPLMTDTVEFLLLSVSIFTGELEIGLYYDEKLTK